MPRNGGIALLVLVLFVLPGRASAAWERRTEHFRVLSEPGPEIAQAAAAHLEAVRGRLASLGLPTPDDSGGPVVVLVFAERPSLYPYAPVDSRDPALTRGLSLAGEEHRWIAIAWEAPGSPLITLAHEYAHLIRQDSSDPLWFREGLAEYLAGLPPTAATPGPGLAAQYHLRLLREQPWTGWEEFLAADRTSQAFARPNFYSQAWLLVHWLVAQRANPAQVQPADLDSLRVARGAAWIDAQLRAYMEQLAPGTLPAKDRSQPDAAASADPPQPLDIRQLDTWELPYWQAELHRELDHWLQAHSALERLEREYPEIPEPSAALGALAMAQGRYELAEEKLEAAVRKGSRTPSTLHRYSTVLLRPLEGAETSIEVAGVGVARVGVARVTVAGAGVAEGASAADRVGRAIRHARQAREANPHEPRYVLGEAQALLVAGQWDPAARLLLELQSIPGWANRAEVEFAELVRRRQQAMRNVPAPTVATELHTLAAADTLLAALVEGWSTAELSDVPKPPPPPRPEFTWPPPGTVLLYGYISGIECRTTEKIVRVRTPRFTIELREKATSPAKLYHPPARWTELPCGLRGREVNVVYRPLPPGGEVRGELVAVVF